MLQYAWMVQSANYKWFQWQRIEYRLTWILYFVDIEDWGDKDGNGLLDFNEIKAFVADSDSFKKMTKCPPTEAVVGKVNALVNYYAIDLEIGDFVIDSEELQDIKNSGYCDCLCNSEDDDEKE